jgi:hypothetical protein
MLKKLEMSQEVNPDTFVDLRKGKRKKTWNIHKQEQKH